MAVKPDGAPPNSEAAAHRRWLITIAITILFGTFGAVMTYLSYAKSSKPWSPSRAPSSVSSTVPGSVPSIAPATPPTEVPPAEPSSGEGDKGKHDKDKDDNGK